MVYCEMDKKQTIALYISVVMLLQVIFLYFSFGEQMMAIHWGISAGLVIIAIGLVYIVKQVVSKRCQDYNERE